LFLSQPQPLEATTMASDAMPTNSSGRIAR
jgi:hypothetical protein